MAGPRPAIFDITYEHVNYFTTAALANLFVAPRQSGILFGDRYQYTVGDDLIVIMNPNYQHEIVAELHDRGLRELVYLSV